MGLGIEISIEVFIDRRGVDLPCHRCTIAGVHLQVTLRRHVSSEPHAKRVELREAIGDGQFRRLIIVLAFYRTGSPSWSQSAALTVVQYSNARICSVESVRCVGG